MWMKIALERHAAGEAVVVPVILRPVDWQATPFGALQAVPKNGKPVTTFENVDIAFEQVAASIRRRYKSCMTVGTYQKPITRKALHGPRRNCPQPTLIP